MAIPSSALQARPEGGSRRQNTTSGSVVRIPRAFRSKSGAASSPKHLTDHSYFLTDYCDPAGLPEFRGAIAAHLGRARDMAVTHDQIVVTAGGQDALNLIVELVSGSISRCCIENPCYLGASMLFRSGGKDVVPISLDAEGLKIEDLPTATGNLLYVAPSHQFPTGVTDALEPPLRVAPMGRGHAELHHRRRLRQRLQVRRATPPPPRWSRRLPARLLYGHSPEIHRSWPPAGYAAVPQLLWDRARMLKAQMSNGQSWLDQAVVCDFLAEGAFRSSPSPVAAGLQARRDCLRSTLEANFKDPELAARNAVSPLRLAFAKNFPAGPGPSKSQPAVRASRVYSLRSGAACDFSGARGTTRWCWDLVVGRGEALRCSTHPGFGHPRIPVEEQSSVGGHSPVI